MAKYCPACGKRIEDESNSFCVYCGHPIEGGTSYSNVETGHYQSEEKRSINPGFIIAIVAVVIAIVLIVVFLIIGQGQKGQSSVSSPSSAPAVASQASQASSSSSVSAPASAFDESASINLDNVDKQHELNLFLSNFTEKGSLMNGYTYSGADPEQVCDFSASHIYLNYPDAIKSGQDGQGKTWEVKEEIFNKYPPLFLKRDTPNVKVGGHNDAVSYYSFEGYVGISPSKVPTSAQGVAYVTGSKNVGNNRTEITFDIYYGGPYTATDESLYNCSLEELKGKLGASTPIASGTAVVEPYDDGSVAPFKLWSYDSTR